MTIRNSVMAGLAAAALVAAGPGGAQEGHDEAGSGGGKGPKISGSVGASFSYDLNDPKGGVTALRSYDQRHNTFRLNAATVNIAGSANDVGYALVMDIGTDAAITKSSGFGTGLPVDPDADIFDLREAYVTFKDPIMKKLGLNVDMKAGKFVTLEGIEVISGHANPTITRGYLFGLAEPFTHVGILASLPAGAITISGGILNGWDQILDGNTAKMGIAGINVNLGDRLGMINLSGYSGAEGTGPGSTGLKKNSVDATGVWKFIPSVELWWQANYGDEEVNPGVTKWGGGGLQPVISLSSEWSVGLRGEYFEKVVPGSPVFTAANGTVTLAWAFAPNVKVRWEWRHDSAKSPTFEDRFGNLRKDVNTLATDLTVTF